MKKSKSSSKNVLLPRTSSKGNFLKSERARVNVLLKYRVLVKSMCDNTTVTTKEFTTGSIPAVAY